MRRTLLLAAVLAFALPASASASSVRVAPTGSDANPCTAAAPCLTMDRAYRVAAPGDDVELATGSYLAQTMTGAPKAAPGVTVRPAAGAAPSLASLRIEGPANLTVRDVPIRAGTVRVINTNTSAGSHDVTLDGLTGASKLMVEGYVTDVTVRHWESGDQTDNQPQIKKYDQGYAVGPERIVIEDSYFHDYRATPNTHTECLQILNGVDITVRRSRFNRCEGTGNIGVTNGPITNLTIENNWIGNGTYGAQITRNVRNLIFRNNSGLKSAFFSDTDAGGPYLVAGNYLPFNSSICRAGTTYDRNVFQGGVCGATDRTVPALKFRDWNAFDLHLAPDSEAVDAEPSGYPSTDIDGDARPAGAAGDVGADEVSGPSEPPAPTPTATPSATPTDTPTPTPTPTAEPTAAPTVEPTPEPTATATPEPTAEPALKCAPTCDETIQALRDKIARALADLN